MKEDNDVYFLGCEKKRSYAGRKKYIMIFLVLLASVMVGGYFVFIDKEPHEGEMLQTISICPEGDVVRKPRFDKDKDITAFYQWFGENLKYPKGLEDMKAKVIVRFVVNTDSNLCDFEVLKAPDEKAFEEAVIGLLKRSPKWSPAELADGTKVRMEFTLPVSFKPGK